MSRGLWTRETVVIFLLAAYLPLAVFWLWYGGWEAAERLAFVVLVLGCWQLVFLLARAQPMSLSLLLTALAIAVLSPEGLASFPLVLGISFGAVMGEQVFGGWGRNVVNPATVALSFLGFGFSGHPWPELLTPVAWSAIPAAVIGVAAGVMPAGVIFGAAVGAAAMVALGALPVAALAAATVVLVLLVADPVTSPTTPLGRWFGGLAFAGLMTLFSIGWHGASPMQQAVAAALLISLVAPALDDAALALWYLRRRRTHGRY